MLRKLRKAALSRKILARSSRGRQALMESLEGRTLMTSVPAGAIAAVTYTANTSWTDTSKSYVLTGDVHVQQGATLTIGSGVHVVTSSGNEIYVSDDNSGAAISITSATLGVILNANTSTKGSIKSTTFAATPLLDSTSPGSLTLSGDTFSSGVDVNPQFVPGLAGNSFTGNSTVYVLGGRAITSSITWPLISNVAQYEIVAYTGSYNSRGVHVIDGSTLTLAPGVKIATDGSSSYGTLDGIYVAEDGTGAGLVAAGTTASPINFAAPLTLDSTADAKLTNDKIGNGFYATTPGSGGISVTGSAFAQTPTIDSGSTAKLTFTTDTFAAGIDLHPQLVPLITADTFSSNTTLYILGGRAITTSITWPVIPNVSQYEIVAYTGSYNSRGVHVIDGAKLTLAPGINISTDGSSSYGTYDGIYVAEDGTGASLSAAGTTSSPIIFTAPLTLDSTASATITNDKINNGFYATSPGSSGISVTGSSFEQTPTIDAGSTSKLNFTTDTFAAGIDLHPQLVPLITSDTFASNSTLYILGGRAITNSITWPVIANVSQYEIVADTGSYNSRGVHVIDGAKLTLAPGLDITTDGSSSYGTYDGIYIAEDGTGASLSAAGTGSSPINFSAPLTLDSTATATITDDKIGNIFYATTPGTGGVSVTGSSFAQTPTIDAGSTSGLTFTTDSFAAGIDLHPQLVPLITTDSFASNTTLYILGGRAITNSITWPVIPNVAQYEIVAYTGSYNSRGVHVIDGATLTLSPGVKITTDGSTSYGTNDGIYISEDSTNAGLIALGVSGSAVTFAAPLTLDATASAKLTDDVLGDGFYSAAAGSGGISITGTSFAQAPTIDTGSASGFTFTYDTFAAGAYMNPQIVSLLQTDSFSSNSTIYVLGGRAITSSTSWPAIPNVSQYQIIADSGSYNSRGVHVVSGATLTLGNGVEVTTDGSSSYGTYDGIYVSEDSTAAKLSAAAVTFVAPVYLEATAGGTVQYSTFDDGLTVVSGEKVTVTNNSLGTGGVTAAGTASATISLAGNWWGSTNATTIAGEITDHTDNAALPTITFAPVLTVDPTVPDLTSTLSLSSTTLTAGGTVTATYSIKNKNNGIGAPATIAVITITGATGTKSLAVVDVPAIAAGGSTGSQTVTVSLPAQTNSFWGTLPGSYTVTITADAGNTVIEQYENNNTASVGVKVSGDTTDPSVIFAGYSATPSQTVELLFSKNVSASLSASDFVLTDSTTKTTIASSNLVLSYNTATNVATLTFKTKLAAGSYVLTLAAAGVTDAYGNPLAATFTYAFTV